MIEFFGAFLGAIAGVFIPTGIFLYYANKKIKTSLKDFKNTFLFESVLQMDIKHEI